MKKTIILAMLLSCFSLMATESENHLELFKERIQQLGIEFESASLKNDGRSVARDAISNTLEKIFYQGRETTISYTLVLKVNENININCLAAVAVDDDKHRVLISNCELRKIKNKEDTDSSTLYYDEYHF